MSKFQKKSYQFDYFSAAYKDFEKDFYEFSNISIPLTFLIDDITYYLKSTGKNYFKLDKKFTKDRKDHYFYFKKNPIKENKNLIRFSYLGHSCIDNLNK